MKRILAPRRSRPAALARAGAARVGRASQYGVTAGEVTSSSAILWTRADQCRQGEPAGGPQQALHAAASSTTACARRSSDDQTVQRRVTRLALPHALLLPLPPAPPSPQLRRHLQDGAQAERQRHDPLRWSGRHGRHPAEGPDEALLEQLRHLPPHAGGAQRLQHPLRRHDLLGQRGARPGQSGGAVGQRRSGPSTSSTSARRKLRRLRALGRLLLALGRPRVRERLRPPARTASAAATAPTRTRQSQRQDDLQGRSEGLPRLRAGLATPARTASTARRRWGKNLELFFLDERSFRSPKASANRRLQQPRARASPTSRPPPPRAPATVFGDPRAVAQAAGVASSALDTINEREPHLPRQAPVQPLHQGGQELEGALQGDHERAADPAVLRRSL